MWGKTRVDESFPSVEMRVVSPSVESVMKLLGCSTFFRGGYSNAYWWRMEATTKTNTTATWNEGDETNQHSFQERKGKQSGPVGNENKLHEKSVHTKEMTEMSFACQWNSKEFHLDRSFRGYQSFNWKTRKQKQIEFLLWRLRAKQREQLVFLHNCNIWLILPVLYASVKD